MKKTIKFLIKQFENLFNMLILKKTRVLNSTDFNNINGLLKIVNHGTFEISSNVRINSKYSANPIGGQCFSSFFIKENAYLFIGANSALSNSTIVCWDSVVIKNNVYIGGDCKIYDTDFHSINFENRVSTPDINVQTKQIIINNNVFIGASVIILKGVTIGENSVIGAGSVVSKDIPPNEIWAGNPAKMIRNIEINHEI